MKKIVAVLIIILILISYWVITDIIPKHKAKVFFNELDSREGFEKLVNNSANTEISKISNIPDILDKGIDAIFEIQEGYQMYPEYNDGSVVIKSGYRVEIYDLNNNFITNGTYLGFWDSNFSLYTQPGYHYICVDAPVKGIDKNFKIDTSKVKLKFISDDFTIN